ncbi:hypothetical protein GIB67_014220 [Kingdonia uniflora]|uniref:Uncharacterized protein n=1 Tax=Kingdonia uniflora TaxID=39325 RepID=A0A7J7M1U6_9MAGN|nr:hypothetical protein GIB67_014220 [Kingdonia uniflora]
MALFEALEKVKRRANGFGFHFPAPDIWAGELEKAIEHVTEAAILLDPITAIMYGIRGSVYIKMKKPNVASLDN